MILWDGGDDTQDIAQYATAFSGAHTQNRSCAWEGSLNTPH